MITKDERIKKDIADNLFWDSRVDASEVVVRVNDGDVVLEGTVPDYSMHRAAESDSWGISGVKKVDNKIMIRSMVRKSSDERIKTDLENHLARLARISPKNLHLSVDSGWVTLKGEIDMFWKKIRAEEIASMVPGVTGVTNELIVVPTDQVTDHEIAGAIMRGLERNPLIDPNSVHITVENGHVFLSGYLATGAALKAVSEFVKNINGVRGVNNNLIVNRND